MRFRTMLLGVVIVAGAVLHSACSIETAWGDRVRGSGDLERQTRSVHGIDAVELATIGTLYIDFGSEEELTIEAEDNLLEYIEVDVRGGKLTIDTERDVSLHPRRKIRYYLTVRGLDELTVSSSGDIQVDGFEAGDFSIMIESSGDIEIDRLECEDLEIRSSSSGDLSIDELHARTIDVGISSSGDVAIDDGRVNEQIVEINSSGDYKARGLESDEARIQISSSGDAYVRVSDYLDARTSSSGDINYYGDPRLKSRETSSGDIHRAGR